MTLHDLLVLREKIREQQATLAKLEQAVGQSQQVVDATTLTLAEAAEQVAATQQRPNELYALRDQLAAAQDEVQLLLLFLGLAVRLREVGDFLVEV